MPPKNVYRQVLSLSFPIILQNLFSTAVTSSDVLMVGAVSQDGLSAISLAGQIAFVLNLILLGLTLGTGLMTAQYWGRKDEKTITEILALALKISLAAASLFALAACLLPRQLMMIFTADPVLIALGSRYLRITGIGFLFTAFSQICEAVMKSVRQIRRSTRISTGSMVLNVLLNALFLYGFGMGVAGVAWATLLARTVEMLCCLKYTNPDGSLRSWGNLLRPGSSWLRRDYQKYTLPVTLNGLSWGTAFACYSIILGRLGSDMVAANALASVIRNFALVGCNGIAGGAAVYLGALLGEGKIREAIQDSRGILVLTTVLGAVAGICILAGRPLFIAFGALSGQAGDYLWQMLNTNALYTLAKALSMLLNNGIFCSGGDTRFGLICDTIDMWCFAVPLGFLAAFVWHLPPMTVYLLISLDEIVKLPFLWMHYQKGTWAQNITRQES